MRRRRALPVFTLAVFLALSARSGHGRDAVPGVVEPRLRVVFSSEFSLPVKRVFPRVGDPFAKGDRLIEFDSSLSEANLAAAQAAEQAAASALRSMETLVESRQVTKVELEIAKRDAAEAGARRMAAERELAATVLYAPFAGRVAERHVNDFEWAVRGTPLLTVVDDTVLQARFILPEAVFSRISPGMPVPLSVHAVGEDLVAEVVRLGAVFDAASRTFDVWAEFDNPAGRYRAGMTAEVDVSRFLSGSAP